VTVTLLYLAPWLLLLIVLALGHYPGERLLEVIVRTRHSAHREQGSAPVRLPPPPRCFPRGGVLLALALAGRGPPR